MDAGNAAPTEHRLWQRQRATDRQKATRWEKYPPGIFCRQNGANPKATKKAGAVITPAER